MIKYCNCAISYNCLLYHTKKGFVIQVLNYFTRLIYIIGTCYTIQTILYYEIEKLS
jgi:hypothetical protein